MSESPRDGQESPETTINRLRLALKSEQDKVRTLQEEIQSLKQHQVEILANAEAQEEFITNKLLKKLETLTTEKQELEKKVDTIQREREALIIQLEQEEEYLTNTLQKKLTTVLREKIELENQLEQEEEYIVNQLQKKLSEMQREKSALEARLQEERESHEVLRRTQAQLQKTNQLNADLQKELAALRNENFGLSQKITKEHEKVVHLSQAKAKLEQGLELEDERQFNEELEMRSLAGPEASMRGRRHRTRSYSSPVHDLLLDTKNPKRMPSSLFSPRNSPVLTEPSPPSSPISPEKTASKGSPSSSSNNVGSTANAASSNTRGRRLSQSVIPMLHHLPSASSTNRKALKQGWIRFRSISKLPLEDGSEPMFTEPANWYFILFDDSLLEAWENELEGQDGASPILSINFDTVQKRSYDDEPGELTLETKDTKYMLIPQSEDTKEWLDLFEQLDPLNPGSSTPHRSS